jgi:putative membrane protein
MDSKQIFKSWLLIALGVLIAANIFGGIHYETTGDLLVAVLLLSLCNVFLKPLLMLFALPFIIMTFGLGIWLINALLFLLVGNLVGGFTVDSFVYALAGALVVSLTGVAANLLFGKTRVQVRTTGNIRRAHSGGPSRTSSTRPQSQKPLKDDDVIDI